MYIQYVGFNGTADSRVYGFHVIDAPHQPREFSVGIQSEVFGSSKLRFQDGPDICFARLKQELLEETQDARVEGHLNISDEDVRMYLETHTSVKVPERGRGERVAEASASLAG